MACRFRDSKSLKIPPNSGRQSGLRVMAPSRAVGLAQIHLYSRTRRRRGWAVWTTGPSSRARWLSQSWALSRTHYDTLGVKRAASRMQIRDHFYKVCVLIVSPRPRPLPEHPLCTSSLVKAL
jgi:hypothetical protein